MIVVLDTNVLVSALLSPFGPPARVLDLVLAGEIRVAYDDRLMAEYREVLSRPRFHFDTHDVSVLLAFLAVEGESYIAPPLPTALPDPDDAMMLEIATVAGAWIVTGNLRHFPESERGSVPVLSPTEFLTWWTTSNS